jgi:hypothetical protein
MRWRGAAEAGLKDPGGRDGQLLGLGEMPGTQEGIGQNPRPRGHHQRVLGSLGGQDSPISRHPRRIGLAQLQHQDRGQLVALGQQARGGEPGVAVQFPSRQLTGRQQLR